MGAVVYSCPSATSLKAHPTRRKAKRADGRADRHAVRRYSMSQRLRMRVSRGDSPTNNEVLPPAMAGPSSCSITGDKN